MMLLVTQALFDLNAVGTADREILPRVPRSDPFSTADELKEYLKSWWKVEPFSPVWVDEVRVRASHSVIYRFQFIRSLLSLLARRSTSFVMQTH